MSFCPADFALGIKVMTGKPGINFQISSLKLFTYCYIRWVGEDRDGKAHHLIWLLSWSAVVLQIEEICLCSS